MSLDEHASIEASVKLVEQRFVHYQQWGQLVRLVIWTLLKDLDDGNAMPPQYPLEQIHQLAARLPMAGPDGGFPPPPYGNGGNVKDE